MLKTASVSDLLKLSVFCEDSVFGAYVMCRAEAYGFERSFAQTYLCVSDAGELVGVVSSLENNAVILANGRCDFEELSCFVASSGFNTILTDEATAKKCGFKDYQIKDVFYFNLDNEYIAVSSEADSKRIYELFSSCFPESYPAEKNSYLSWLSDFMFRKNRGLARLKAVIGGETLCAAAVTGAEFEKAAVISSVACRSDCRKMGYGKAVTLALAGELKAENKKVYVISKDRDTAAFYLKLGFKNCGRAAYIERL